uniref:Uncharacterized protein n=1 Tax=Anguilla anguilla TaxID=7936 RepID=A0A0E9X7N8_ANGAN
MTSVRRKRPYREDLLNPTSPYFTEIPNQLGCSLQRYNSILNSYCAVRPWALFFRDKQYQLTFYRFKSLAKEIVQK